MSVLDRAIVRAYALQKSSAPPGSSDQVPPRPLESPQSAGGSDAALATAETVSTLLHDDVDARPPAEWETLVSTVAATPPPVIETQSDRGAPHDSAPLIESESPSLDASHVFADEVPVRPLAPRQLVADSTGLAAVQNAAHHSTATETHAGAVATLAPPAESVREIYQAPPRSTEVAWDWPEICEQLDQFTGDGFRQLAKHLQFAAGQGHKVLAFVGTTANTGRTSVVLTLTRILALEGRTSALLIDADRRRPQLASLTRLNTTAGLCEVLYGQAPLDQAAVRRTPGLISLLPLRTAVSDAEWGKLVAPLRALVKQARQNYDLVLIDAGVFGPETRLSDCWLRGAADAVITISRQLTGSKTTHDVLNWKQIGIESLGVIETFS